MWGGVLLALLAGASLLGEADGAYQSLGAGPIAVAHAKQLPGTDRFLLMEFGPTGVEGKLMQEHPPSNPLGKNPLWIWDRGSGSWTNVPTKFNSICGGWAKLPNGQVGMFSGHYQTLDFTQLNSMNRAVLFDPATLTVTPRMNLTGKRWYPTVLTLPSGDQYVPGGTWEQKKTGQWPKNLAGADIYSHANNKMSPQKMNAKLWNAGLGNWYMGAMVLPTGQLAIMNKNMMQVINPYTGEALAEAPPLPTEIKDLVWEFPRMGPQVHLRAPIMEPGKTVRLEFMAFGGSWVDAVKQKSIDDCGPITCDRQKGQFDPCADVSVRMGLTVEGNGKHTFDDAWEVEKMPDRRCVFDGSLLPNGEIILLGGQRQGVGDLVNVSTYNGGNEPHNEAWLYSPDKAKGQRFTKTGALTRIARLYHATSIITSNGDIFVGGSSNAAFWKGARPQDFDRSPTVNEFRNEIFSPSFLSLTRPVITSPPPTWVPYGSSFTLGYSGPKPTEVVLYDLGGVTHNYNIGHRAQQLRFTDSAGVLTIQAPANSNIAPPSHYVVFLVSGMAYSKGAWVQVRPAPPASPTTMPQDVELVEALSNTFEPNGPKKNTFVAKDGAAATGSFASTAARGAGRAGFRAQITNAGSKIGSISMRTVMAKLFGGKTCYAHVWLRAEKVPSVNVRVYQKTASGVNKVAENTINIADSYTLRVIPEFTPPADGDYSIHFYMGGSGTGSVDVDDMEVYCKK